MSPLLDRPYSLWVQPTRRSNLRSKLSYDSGEIPDQPELTLAEMKGLLGDMFEQGVISLFYEGGEPLLRPDFMEIVRYSTPQAYVIVRTNGTLIDDRIADELAEANVGLVCVDVQGARAATHDALTGTPGSHEKAVEGIRRLASRGIPIYLTCIMNRQNVGELQELLELAAELTAPKLSVLRLYPLGMARKHWKELALPLREQRAALESLEAPPGVDVMHSWHPNDPNCCWQNAAVDATGNSIGCPYLRDYVNYGNVREESFMETWNHPLYVSVRSVKVDDACPDCAGNEGTTSPGGCRSTAFAFTGDWEAGDPVCETMNDGIDLTVLPDWLDKAPFGPIDPSPRELVIK